MTEPRVNPADPAQAEFFHLNFCVFCFGQIFKSRLGLPGSRGSPGTWELTGLEGIGALFGQHLLPIPSLCLVKQRQRIPPVSCPVCFRPDPVATLIQNAGAGKTFPVMEISVTYKAPWQVQVGILGAHKSIFIQKLGNPQLIP